MLHDGHVMRGLSLVEDLIDVRSIESRHDLAKAHRGCRVPRYQGDLCMVFQTRELFNQRTLAEPHVD